MNTPLPQIAFWFYAVVGLVVALYLWWSDAARERIKSVRSIGRLTALSEFTVLVFLLLWPFWLGVLWLAGRDEKRQPSTTSSTSDAANA